MGYRFMTPLKRVLGFARPYRRLAIFSLGALAAMVACDLAIPRLVERVIDDGVIAGNPAVLVHTALIMLAVAILDAFVAVLNNLFSVRVGEGVARDVRAAVFARLQKIDWRELDRFPTGLLMVRLAGDTSSIQRLVQVTLRIGTRAPLLMAGSVILMVMTAPQLALLLVPLLGAAAVTVGVFSAKMEPLFRSAQRRMDRLNTILQENVAGVRLVKAFVRARSETARFGAANAGLTGETVRVMRYMSSLGPALTLLVNAAIVVVVWAGGIAAAEGGMKAGRIVAFVNYLLAILGPLVMTSQLANTWANGLASSRRVGEILDAPESPVPESPVELPAGGPLGVEFRDVTFRYDPADEMPVIDGVSFVAEPGKTLALLGSTGSGKSTIVNLIPGFYRADSGTVLVGGIPVERIDRKSLLSRVSAVPQETVLFTGTVRDNVRYAKPEADDAEVEAAARDAGAHGFVAAMPGGYSARVEERGVNLSGGQKQRLAIARAILPNPGVLILDDSTSAVDTATETLIHDAIARRMAGGTVIVIAQRVSTVINADKILVLENGRIAASGTHRELLASSAAYREIYDSQLGGGIPKEASHGL